jgi:two-component SAPR family response regulator
MAAASPTLAVESAGRRSAQAPVVAIRLLGPLVIEPALRRSVRAATEELVAFLAVRRSGASRDELVEVLWPGCDPPPGRQRLWQSASEARQILGAALVHERGRYRLERQQAWVDVDELDRLLTWARKSGEEAERIWEEAYELFRGEPLAGVDYPWAAGECRRLQAVFVDLAGKVGRVRLRSADYPGTLDACERGLASDRLNECLTRLAMEAEAALGLRTALEARYETLQRRLGERFGLEPERETRLLRRALLSQA